MTTRSYRGDAPAVQKVVYIPRPDGYTSGPVNIHINNKTITVDEWDVDALVTAWNSSTYPETTNITASASGEYTEDPGQYGVTVEPDGLILTADVAGEDFFVTITLGDGTLVITNEIQYLTFDPIPDGGTFTLTYSGQTTGAITYVDGNPSTTASNITTALEALSNIGSGDVAVAYVSEGVFSVTFQGALASSDLVLMTCNYTNLTGGDVEITVETTQQGVLPTDEVQTLSLPSAPTGGTFTLTYAGQTTGNIAYNANAATVQAALEALSNIAVGDVVCSGGALPATPIVITFAVNLGDQDIVLITGNGTNLTGGSANIASITTVTNGGTACTTQKTRWYHTTPGFIGDTYQWRVLDANGDQTTANFNASDSAATIAAALASCTGAYPVNEGLYVANVSDRINYSFAGGTFTVTGTTSGNDLTVEFGGQLAGKAFRCGYNQSSPGDIDCYRTTGGSTSQLYAAAPQSANSGNAEEQSYQVTDNTRVGTYTLNLHNPILSTTPVTATINYSETSSLALANIFNTALFTLGAPPVAVYASTSGSTTTIRIRYLNFGYQNVNANILTANEITNPEVSETTKGSPGTREQHTIVASFSELIRAGTFTITYDGQTTSALAYDASAATILAAIEALSNVAPSDLIVIGGPINSNSIVLSWRPTLGNINEVSVTNSLVNSILEITEYLSGGLTADCEEIVRNKGPECFDDPLNYDPQGLPSDSDTLLFEFGQAACKWGIKQRDTFTVDTSLETIKLTCKRPLFQDGQSVRVRSSGTAPTGLTANNAYYVVNADNKGNLQLSSTLGGSAINITGAGSGTHTLELQLATLRKPAKYPYDIGLARNNSGFEEYRPRYLEAAIVILTLGEGDGSDSGLTRFDLGDRASTVTIYNTGSGAEPDTPACCILNENSATDVLAYGGQIGIPPWLDETCEIHDLKCFDTTIKAIGGLTLNDLTLDKGCEIVGQLTINGTTRIGL